MKRLATKRFHILIWLLFAFSVPMYSQCLCFNVNAGWSDATGGPIPFGQIGWHSCLIQEYYYRTGGCGYAVPASNGGFTFAVIDTASGSNSIWASHHIDGTNFGQFGNYHCDSFNHNGFDFRITGNHPVDTAGSTVYSNMPWPVVIDSFIDQIPSGAIIIMYSVNIPPYTSLWNQDSTLVNKLVAMGATDLRLLCDSTSPGHLPSGPYIFWTQKGNQNWGGQAVRGDYNSSVAANFNFCYGDTTTTRIPQVNASEHFQVYPNPSESNGKFFVSTSEPIRIKAYDALGQVIYDKQLSPGINVIEIDTHDALVLYTAERSNGTKVNGKLFLSR